MQVDLQTTQANGVPFRYLKTPEGTPYVCGADVVAASGLTGKCSAAKLRRWLGDENSVRVDRRDHPEAFGNRGRPDMLFFRFDAVESWARTHPDGVADRLIRGLRLTHFRPFGPADD